jgi:C1A family cysteine protease/PKD repeat protein
MKKILLSVFLVYTFLYISAQTKPNKAPLNPEFLKYIEYSKTNIQKKSTEEFKKGYVPSPMNIHFSESQVRSDVKKSMQAFPAKCNLKDSGWITPVRNQGPVGACWSFSTMGAIESRWLKLGYGDLSLNLSEQNMATCHGFQAGINDGGSDFIAAAYLSRLSGPVTEASDPYTPVLTATCKKSGLVHPAYSPQTIWLPQDINIIKKAIVDYGAVTASIFMDEANCYNPLDKTFFYNGTAPVDHGVLCVGWNDDLKVTGKSFKPVNKGAWIVKNSWGNTWGDRGYFYVSYEDTKFLSSCSYYPERIELSEIDTMIMFDWLGQTSSYGFRNETASAVMRENADQSMFINKVGTFINSSGSMIDVEIYKEFIGDSVLTNLVASSYNNFCKFPGYYTFDIAALVQGSYYVKVKYYTPGYNYPVPVEAEIVYGGKPYALPILEPSGRFWMSGDEKEWQAMGSDIKDWEADLSIRVYADRNTELNAFFKSDDLLRCVNTDFVFTDESHGTVNQYSWDFGAGATPATANTSGPHKVKYSTPGLKDISLTITGPTGTKTLVKKSYVEVATALDIFLPYSEKLLVNGKTITLVAYGADTYSWAPATSLSSTTGATVIASPTDTVTYTVTGTMGSCTGEASVTLNIVNAPSNDDVCDAIELQYGGHIYKNTYATVEDGEPAPPEGDCNTPLEWCVEGGLQNSVWFWFTAPASGKVSITTKGLDTQIAVYKADKCDSILLGGYKMIAANDDYFGEADFYAAALGMVDVIPGQKYFVQIDGSHGGDYGDFSMIYWESPVSVPLIKDSGKLSLYPSPNNGTFRYEYKSEGNEDLKIRVLNTKGQEVYLDILKNIPQSLQKEIYLGKTTPGIYIFELTSGNQVIHKNFIIQ